MHAMRKLDFHAVLKVHTRANKLISSCLEPCIPLALGTTWFISVLSILVYKVLVYYVI